MLISMIAAVSTNGVIGRNNQLPWRVRDDLRFFHQTTHGHVVITGRKNFEAMGRALPHRINIVMTRNPTYVAEGAQSAADVRDALRYAKSLGESEAFIIGGAEIYRAAKPFAHRYYRTTILANVDGDVRYDDTEWDDWGVQWLADGPANSDNEYAFRIELLTRNAPPQPFE